MTVIKKMMAGCMLLGLTACASTGPVIYPNAHFLSTGKDAANRDIEACKAMAEAAGAEAGGGGRLGNVATSTAMGAGVGAVSGAAGGAVYGSVGQGSLVGAASGAVAGLLRGLMYSQPQQTNQAYANFVSRCLEEKGYEVTGWQ